MPSARLSCVDRISCIAPLRLCNFATFTSSLEIEPPCFSRGRLAVRPTNRLASFMVETRSKSSAYWLALAPFRIQFIWSAMLSARKCCHTNAPQAERHRLDVGIVPPTRRFPMLPVFPRDPTRGRHGLQIPHSDLHGLGHPGRDPSRLGCPLARAHDLVATSRHRQAHHSPPQVPTMMRRPSTDLSASQSGSGDRSSFSTRLEEDAAISDCQRY